MSLINDQFKLNYEPARICQGKQLLVVYYYWDINKNKKVRKIMRFNHLIGKYSKREIQRILIKVCAEINMKLEAGKNPGIEAEMPKAYTKIKEAIEIYLSIKKKQMREDGYRSYKSFVNKLYEFLDENKISDCYVISFNKDIAVDFLTELELDKAVGNRTWNNYLAFYRTLWNWLIEKNYIKVNVFEGFRKKEEPEKLRKIIDDKTHSKIVEYCSSNMPNFEIVIDLVRCAFIRPAEICKIQIENVDLQNKVIHIPAGKAKTKKFRYSYLPEWLCDKIKSQIKLDRYPKSFYLFTRDLNPGPVKIGTRELDKMFTKMRDETKIGSDKQLYSYRDTGITNLENMGIPRSVIQKLTDHHTEKMVGKYVHSPSTELMEGVVSKIT